MTTAALIFGSLFIVYALYLILDRITKTSVWEDKYLVRDKSQGWIYKDHNVFTRLRVMFGR